jgi:HEAT repeat protein
VLHIKLFKSSIDKESIDRMENKKDYNGLIKMLVNTAASPAFRADTMEALVRIGDTKTANLLIKELENNNLEFGTRILIVTVLGEMGEISRKPLLQALSHDSSSVRVSAVSALKIIEGKTRADI